MITINGWEIIAVLEDCAFDEAVQRAYSQERNALRSEKERPWGLRTYRPFRGQLQDAKPQMSSKSRGRRRKYDWKRILAVFLCKGVRSFSDLEQELRDTGYCKVDGLNPKHQILNNIKIQNPKRKVCFEF